MCVYIYIYKYIYIYIKCIVFAYFYTFKKMSTFSVLLKNILKIKII